MPVRSQTRTVPSLQPLTAVHWSALIATHARRGAHHRDRLWVVRMRDATSMLGILALDLSTVRLLSGTKA